MNLKSHLQLIFFLFLISNSSVGQEIIEREKNELTIIEVYYSTGDKTIEIENINGQLNGISYWENGNIKESYSICQKSDTLGGFNFYDNYIEFFPSGKVKRLKFFNCGVATGIWHEYFESGRLKSKKSFSYDSTNTRAVLIQYDITIGDHNIGSSSTSIFAGFPNGEWIEWYENGNRESEKHFTNGLSTGIWTWYYENGNKRKQGQFAAVDAKFPNIVKLMIEPDDIEDKIAADFFPHLVRTSSFVP